MRWYIKNYSVSKLSERLGAIKSSAIQSGDADKTVVIVSEDDGVFCAQDNRIYKMHYDSKFSHFFFNQAQLICQYSDPIKEEIVSQMPVKYVVFNQTTVKYSIDCNPCILLCIEYREGSIHDFYFEVISADTSTDTSAVVKKTLVELINGSKKDINGFLLLLN
jgi:hypothetical protein